MGLESTHFDSKDAFTLRGQFSEHITLETSQHPRLQLFMELLDLCFVVDVVQVELVRQGNYGIHEPSQMELDDMTYTSLASRNASKKVTLGDKEP
jgi:hypothetical protein